MEPLVKKPLLRKWDAVILLSVFLLCLTIFAAYSVYESVSGRLTAVIIENGETVREIPLSEVKEEYTLTLDNGIVLQIKKDSVAFVNSPCQSKLCIHTGALTKAGQSAVCLPEKTAVYIKGEREKNAPDALSY